MPGALHRKQITVEIAAPHAALLEMEARTSGRTVSQHVGHILARRYMELMRVCACGFFIYSDREDQLCSICQKDICSHCAVPVDELHYCSTCAPVQSRGDSWGLAKE